MQFSFPSFVTLAPSPPPPSRSTSASCTGVSIFYFAVESSSFCGVPIRVREKEGQEIRRQELSLWPVIRADATLIILLFDGTRARGGFVAAEQMRTIRPRDRVEWKSCVNDGGTVAPRGAWLAMNLQIKFSPFVRSRLLRHDRRSCRH